MKAIVYSEYGSPDVLRLVEMEKPTPNDEQVLVKIHAASANPLDWHLMRGVPFLARTEAGLFKPKAGRLGADIAGVVEAVGKAVTQFKVGDAVFGDIGFAAGGFAEYAVSNPKNLALKPANLSFEEAAAAPVAALTALQGLRHGATVQAGQKVLVNGASGGVGSFAVQFAKAFGADVTGVCSTRNLDLVRSIGADQVVDYTRADFTQQGIQYDLIYDAVGNRSVLDCRKAVKAGGRFVIAGFTSLPLMFSDVLLGLLLGKLDGKQYGMMGTAHVDSDDMRTMAALMASKKVVPLIDRRYPLSETAEAIRYLETSRARGKVIVTVMNA